MAYWNLVLKIIICAPCNAAAGGRSISINRRKSKVNASFRNMRLSFGKDRCLCSAPCCLGLKLRLVSGPSRDLRQAHEDARRDLQDRCRKRFSNAVESANLYEN